MPGPGKPFTKDGDNDPFGNLPIGEDLKNARKLTRVEFERLCNKYMHMSLGEIERVSTSKDLPFVEAMIVSIMIKALKHGDEKRMDFLLDRMIGQVVRKIRVVAEQEDVPHGAPIELTGREKVEMLDKMKQKINQEIERTVIDVEPKKD